jgi:Niemann-Pick C1 protein
MWADTTSSLSISMGAIFVVIFVLTGFNSRAALIVLVTITMILTHMLGMMYYWGISLNAVSLVNLVMVNFLFNI